MQKRWQIILCLAAVAGYCWFGKHAIAQTNFQAPQNPQPVQYPQGAAPATPAGAPVTLTPAQIDQLLGSVALYPDPLLALIFPAATFPQDITAANQWLASNPNPTEAAIAAQNWDDSIKGLVHYPTVLKMMSDQIDWTQTVGAAFLDQQKDVLASVQRLRALAQAARNLQTTPQEQIVADGDAIRIEPVDPDTMYVPQYDPNEVYFNVSPITYSNGYPIGLWDDDDFDWGLQGIVVGGGWYTGWHHPPQWDQHPPAWNRRPPGWSAAPKPWSRAPQKPAPRITPDAVNHLGLDHPHAASANPNVDTGRKSPQPLPVVKPIAPQPLNNAFDSSESREDVQRDEQRAHPTPAPQPQRVEPAPQQQRIEPQQAPERAAPAQRESAPPPSPRSNAFSGGSGGEARAQSARGNASVHR